MGEEFDVGGAVAAVEVAPFIARGTVVNGGGKALPLVSPLTLLFNGGSSREAPFFFPEPAVVVFPAPESGCVKMCSKLGSTDQKNPFPRSPAHRSIFLKARFEERLCLTEFYSNFI